MSTNREELLPRDETVDTKLAQAFSTKPSKPYHDDYYKPTPKEFLKDMKWAFITGACLIFLGFSFGWCAKAGAEEECNYWTTTNVTEKPYKNSIIWDSSCGRDIQKKIDAIAVRTKNVSEKAVGLVYLEDYSWRSYDGSRIWKEFKNEDIDDKVDGHTKIFGVWFENTNIIFYESPYKAEMDRIEKSYKSLKAIKK